MAKRKPSAKQLGAKNVFGQAVEKSTSAQHIGDRTFLRFNTSAVARKVTSDLFKTGVRATYMEAGIAPPERLNARMRPRVFAVAIPDRDLTRQMKADASAAWKEHRAKPKRDRNLLAP